MAKTKFIITGDIHLNNWNQFNMDFRRTDLTLQYLEYLLLLSAKHSAPILLTGDFWHTPESVSTKLLAHVMPKLNLLSANPQHSFWGISGNHDLPEINTIDHKKSPSLWDMTTKLFPKVFHNLDFASMEFPGNYIVYGIPYIDHNVGMVEYIRRLKLDKSKTNILLIHTDLHGAKDTSGRLVNSTENINRQMRLVFKKFDYVFSGHIHRPQKLGRNTYMIGAPYQQTRGDAHCQMGFWVLKDDGSVKFRKFKAPTFKSYNEGTEPEDDYNYWTVIPKPKPIAKDKPKPIQDIQDHTKVGLDYCKLKKVKDPQKINTLTNLLKETEA